MTIAVFTISAGAGSALLLLSLASLICKNLRFWPPVSTDHWQYPTFWWLFRTLVAGVVGLSFLDYSGAGNLPTMVKVFSWLLAISGFGLAFYITSILGWRDAHGEANELATEGWFAWSRNPIYVVSFMGILGLGLAIHSVYVYALLLLWALLYVVAPYLEEPWLEAQFGENYLDYMHRVPRFIGSLRK
jgi:protein-S-isoprenylcysteine O-methyltransferase Ste14